MVRCPEGHFYDAEKHKSCPWCALPPEGATGEEKTRPVAAPGGRSEMAGATQRLDRTPHGVQPVVGWLVCVDGPDSGRDYRLHAEKNFIGRDISMDVYIASDASISRQRHAAVIFDPKKRVFWLHPGESAGLVYCNDEVVNAPVQLNPGDVVEMGKTKLVLTPFQSDKARW